MDAKGFDVRSRFKMPTLVGFAVVAILASTLALAQQIQIGMGDCASGVHLVARGARLSNVLAELSAKLGFSLQFESNSDPVINVDVSRQGPEMVTKLSPSDSVIVTQERDPDCPRRY